MKITIGTKWIISFGLILVSLPCSQVLADTPTVWIDAPTQGSTISGTVNVSGWAIDNTSSVGTAISSVQVTVDGSAVGTATYGASRPDVCAAYPGRPGCPNVGYSFSLNTTTLSVGTHTITVTATDSDGTPDSGSSSVTVSVTTTPPTVWIDAPTQGSTISGTVNVSGWAIDNTSSVGTAISSVQVTVDGSAVGTATYGASRPDVCAAYPGRPGCPNVGYSFSLNTTTLSVGTHTITVTATDSDGTPDSGSSSVTVAQAAAPTITAVTDDTGATDTTGAVGQRAYIYGGGFGATQGSSTVTFNGTAATITTWSASTISTSVPTGATTGNLVVTVGGQVSNAVTYTVLNGPNLLLVTDWATGQSVTSAAVGQAVNIFGGGFGTTQGSSTVTFNGTVATVTSWSPYVVTASIPAGATTGNLVVTVAGVASNAVSFTILVAPNITAVTDDTGATDTTGAVGQRAYIYGGGFGATQGSSTVTFNGTAATITTWSASTISTSVPTGATTGNLVVTVGGQASNAVTYTVLNGPNLLLVTDWATGQSVTSAAVGQAVNIFGGGFGTTQGSSTVTFNGTVATVTSWSPYVVTASIPAGATTGNLVVTVGGVASNAVPFTILAPNITSLSSAFGAPGLAVTISGSAFGGSQGSSTVTFNGTAANVASWSNTQIIASVPAGATSGNVLVTVGGTASNGASFTIVAPPSISASASPAPNSAGWNDMNVTVTFACTPGGLAIATCPGTQNVSSSGANQVVSGTVADVVGDTAMASITLNVDTTQPILTITSPSNGSTVSSSTLTVTGSLSDSLSGTSGVTCDGAAASLVSGSFSCNVSLNTGNNLVIVRGTNLAGNVAGANFYVTFSGTLPAPNSVAVTPASVNMLVTDTQQFTAIDDQGRVRTDATWSVSDTSIATIDTNSSPTLTPVTTGQVTLTATVGSVNANATVTILSGTSLSPGTPRWSVPGSGGFSNTILAQPSYGGPDLFEMDGTLVRAFTADGQQLWSAQSPQNAFIAAPDLNGGVLAYSDVFNPTPIQKLFDLDAQTGALIWEYDSPGPGENSGAIALGGDGKIYWRAGINSGSGFSVGNLLVGLDGNTGTLVSQYLAPDNSVLLSGQPYNGQSFDVGPASLSTPTVGPDGNMYALVQTETWTAQGGGSTYTLSSFNFTVSLLQMKPDGTTTLTPVHANSALIPGPEQANCYVPPASGEGQRVVGFPVTCIYGGLWQVDSEGSFPTLSIGQVIPDGQGGFLASWLGSDDGSTSGPQFHITDVTSNGQTTFVVPFAGGDGTESMILGDNHVLFVLDSNGGTLGAFDLSNNGQALWTYQPSQGSLSLSVSSAGGGIVATLGQSIVLRFDSTGQLSQDSWTGEIGLTFYINDNWFGLSPSGNTFFDLKAPIVALSGSDWYAAQRMRLTAMGTQDIYVSGYSNDPNGTNQISISTVFQKIASALASDQTGCNTWLVSQDGELTGLSEIQLLLQNNAFGHATVHSPSGPILYDLWAFSFPKNPDLLPVLNLPDTSLTTINDPGGFFNATEPLLPPYNGTPFQLGRGAYRGNTLQAQALTLIHEVAHLIGVNNFKQDGIDRILSENNTDTVYAHCGKLIGGLR